MLGRKDRLARFDREGVALGTELGAEGKLVDHASPLRER